MKCVVGMGHSAGQAEAGGGRRHSGRGAAAAAARVQPARLAWPAKAGAQQAGAGKQAGVGEAGRCGTHWQARLQRAHGREQRRELAAGEGRAGSGSAGEQGPKRHHRQPARQGSRWAYAAAITGEGAAGAAAAAGAAPSSSTAAARVGRGRCVRLVPQQAASFQLAPATSPASKPLGCLAQLFPGHRPPSPARQPRAGPPAGPPHPSGQRQNTGA